MSHRPIMLAGAAVLALAACGDGEEVLQNNLTAGEPVTNEVTALVPVAANPVEYANLVASYDRYLIESAELALERSENPELRALAETSIRDHRRSTEMLREMGAAADPPIAPDATVLPTHDQDLAALGDATGAGFEELWLLQHIAAQEKLYAMVRDYASEAIDGTMKQHAQQVVDSFAQHLTQTRALAERMKAPQ